MSAGKRNPGLEKMIKQRKKDVFFRNADEFISGFENYITDCASEFATKPPSFTRFAEYLDVSPRSVYRYLEKYAEADRIIRQMLADAIVELAIVGKYRDAVSIFTLKNRCNWTDKRETTNTNRAQKEIVTPDEARANVRKIFRSLGFDERGRETAEARKSMEEYEGRVIQLAEAKTPEDVVIEDME